MDRAPRWSRHSYLHPEELCKSSRFFWMCPKWKCGTSAFFLLQMLHLAATLAGWRRCFLKSLARTLLKPICSQANPTKPLGLGGLEVCGLTVDSDTIVRLVCCLFRKPWAEWTQHFSEPKAVLSGRMGAQCQDSTKKIQRNSATGESFESPVESQDWSVPPAKLPVFAM